MEKSVFRKSSIDRISSPEQLTDYIRVANPSVWVILIASAALLISVLIWSIFGALPDTLRVNTIIQNGTAVCYVDNPTAAKLKEGMAVKIGDTSGVITNVSKMPVSVAELEEEYSDKYTLSVLIAGEWNYSVNADIHDIQDGLYEMQITIDSIKPISFLWN